MCECVCHMCARGRSFAYAEGALVYRPRRGGRDLAALLVLMSRDKAIKLLNVLTLSAKSLGTRDPPFPLFSLFASPALPRLRRSFSCLYSFWRMAATVFSCLGHKPDIKPLLIHSLCNSLATALHVSFRDICARKCDSLPSTNDPDLCLAVNAKDV